MNPARYRKDYTPSPSRIQNSMYKIFQSVYYITLLIHRTKTVFLTGTEKDVAFDRHSTHFLHEHIQKIKMEELPQPDKGKLWKLIVNILVVKGKLL